MEYAEIKSNIMGLLCLFLMQKQKSILIGNGYETQTSWRKIEKRENQNEEQRELVFRSSSIYGIYKEQMSWQKEIHYENVTEENYNSGPSQ